MAREGSRAWELQQHTGGEQQQVENGSVAGLFIRRGGLLTSMVRAGRGVRQRRVGLLSCWACRYLAHVESSSEVSIGDYVRLEGCRPLSKNKRFTVAEVIRAADK